MNRRVLIPCATAAFNLSLALSLGAAILPGCSPSGMYCLVANGKFVARFVQTEGPDNCLGKEVDNLYFNFYLNPNPAGERGDPKSPRVGMSLTSAVQAINDAEAQIEALRGYAACPTPDPAVPTEVDDAFLGEPYFTLANFDGYLPDEGEQCYASQFSVANLNIPALPSVPACPGLAGYEEEREALGATTLNYKIRDLKVKNSPASQGVWVQGSLEYSTPDCSATYSFTAINPVMPCATDAECSGPDSTLPEDVVAAGVVCLGATDPAKKDGVCVLANPAS